MTDLQQARADWLDAESRLLKLHKEYSDLQQQFFELQMKCYVMEARAVSAEASMRGFMVGVFAR